MRLPTEDKINKKEKLNKQTENKDSIISIKFINKHYTSATSSARSIAVLWRKGTTTLSKRINLAASPV